MRGETGLGWDATENTIMEDDDWWSEDNRYKKFGSRDLSLIWFRYDALFSDVATGERARAVNQEHMSGIGVNLDREGINDIDGYDKEHFINPNDEGSDEVMIYRMWILLSSMREEIHPLMEFMSIKSIATSPSVDDPVMDKCMNVLATFPDIEGSAMYNYTCNMFLKKDVRQIFLKMTTDEARKSWLEYN
ncbi:hypothetical protein RND71_005672 [Anisodus tanguticus]|uniref:Myb/SANT-like domain-containing protein n=1 Tax=Anisodus tanguticus TaxID=243964 RepID=A0AAE1VVN5_9SOLA|nr:hypothetical protein RND71_005672 [Anisodus tanguticus]